MQHKLWFKAKKYGWGWYPATKEGWAVMFVYLGFVLSLSLSLEEKVVADTLIPHLILVTAATTILIVISYKKGAKPGWRWGDKSSK